MKNHFFRFLLIFLLYHATESFASHMRGGDIKIDRVESAGLNYKITISKYLNTASSVESSGELNLGDGIVIDLSTNNFLVSKEPLNESITLEVYEVFSYFPRAWFVPCKLSGV